MAIAIIQNDRTFKERINWVTLFFMSAPSS